MSKRTIYLWTISLILSQSMTAQSFIDEQRRFPHVKAALTEKSTLVDSLFKIHHLQKEAINIFLRAFKNEKRLELWAKNTTEEQYHLIRTYPFCEVSGGLGPKRKEGDGQIPEGVYRINHFNPESNFYLSLGISYPNKSDAILGAKGKLGGAIYIHGNCVTIGCIPITDDLIKELYVIAVISRSGGQQEIPVHIFPTALDDKHLIALKEYVKSDTVKFEFWKNLSTIYQQFESTKSLMPVTIDNTGRYIIH